VQPTNARSPEASESLQAWGAIARDAGWGAAEILRSYYRGDTHRGDLDVRESKDGPVTAADLAANRFILQHLRTHLPDIPFGYLSEEDFKTRRSQHDNGIIPGEWVWVIDPLDGTRDFVDRTGEYALHIALTHSGRPVIGIVVCPEAERLYCAIIGQGTTAYRPDGSTYSPRVRSCAEPGELAIVVSRSHRDARFNALLDRLPFADRRAVGSVGGKIVALIEQRADAYISLSGKSAPKDWDMAAPELVLTEAGGQFTRFDGSPLRYNTGDPNQWGGLIATNGPCHTQLCQLATAELAAIDAQAAPS
jgi:3'(2'), 5'-bisphosphate nucleotidase